MSVTDYGWSASCGFVREGCESARVLRAAGRHVSLVSGAGELEAESTLELLPGDWVAWDPATRRVEALLPRRGVLARKRPGRATLQQPIAANVDVVLIVQGLDGDFNLRRLERYLLLAAACGIRAAIVLNKADLLSPHEADRLAAQVRRRTQARLATVSALCSGGLDQIHELVAPRETAVLLGSSGAGKSTLTNALLGRGQQRTLEVRESDGRGRHTTTARELFLLPAGWLLLDTPGLREVEAWSAEEALGDVFGDIAELAAQCRFGDCRHQGEPGCAVREAEAAGDLDPDRLEHYSKLARQSSEQEYKRNARIAQRSIRLQYKLRGKR